MKSKVLQRPMFMSPDEVENVGIMQGFMDDMEDVFAEDEEDVDMDEADAARMMGRTPDSPEILMNNLRGDVRSVDARVEELADMVGYRAASETPMEVLALLQPVLAGQGQGIAALPMGGAPDQAMPPMPDALPAMPPEAQVAGAPPAMPAGGIASLPQGDTMPMQMAKGGIVQHFQEGSDEDGVTPAGRDSSSGNFSQSLRDAASDEILRLLTQKPRDVPTLQGAMQSRLPEYQALLGTGDKDSMRASMLFDIAQAALGYAGNVGPQGQPLRGSQAARLAGAASALPGQIGTRLAAQQQQEQAVRMAALQAGEKEIEGIRGANEALTREQRTLMQTLAKEPPAGKSFRMLTKEELASNFPQLDASLPWGIDETGKPSIVGGRPPAGTDTPVFGSSMPGRALSFVTENADLYRDGLLSPEETRVFEASVNELRQPRPTTDPITQQIVFVPQELPEFVQDAISVRTGTPTGTAPQLGQAVAPTDQSALPILERDALQVMPRTENYFEPNMPSLFGASEAQGPIPALKAFTFRTPIVSAIAASDAGSATQGRQFIEAVKNSLTAGFQAGTDRFTNTERQQLLTDLNMAATVIDTPEAFRARLFTLDDALQGFQAAAQATYRNENMPAENRRNAASKLADIHEIRALIGAPLHANSLQDPRLVDIVKRYPVGTPVTLLTNPSTGESIPVTYTINEQMKRSVSGAQ
jgi:hypothetical protein